MKNRKGKRRKKNWQMSPFCIRSNCQSFKIVLIDWFLAALGLLAIGGLSPVAENGGYSTVNSLLVVVAVSCCGAEALGHAGFSRCGVGSP